MSASLSDTLAPPRMATSGRAGASKIRARTVSSCCMRSPATAGRRWRVMPSVEAWARCAAANASSTYTSPSRASARANAGSFASSPAWNRRFSSRSTRPSASAAAWVSTAGPTQSGARGTDSPRSAPSRRATGAREYRASGPPFGRPRWDATTIPRAPRARA